MDQRQQEDLAEQYRAMPHDELVKLAQEYPKLTDASQAALRNEFVRRGLQLPIIQQKSPVEIFAAMSHRRLMQAAETYESMPTDFQQALQHELASRGLELSLDESGVADEEGPSLQGPNVLVTVARYRDLAEALVARSVLESAGILCFLRDENTVRMEWFWSNLIGGMRLQVAPEDEPRARELLTQPILASIALPQGEEFVQPSCPVCGSLDIGAEDSDRKVLAASMLLGLPLPHTKPAPDRWRCHTCGAHWEDTESD